MNLYELKGAYANIQTLIEQGDDLEPILETIDAAIEDKAEGYAKVIRNLESDVVAFKEEEKRLKEKRQSIEKNIERLKTSLFDAMNQTGKTKFKTSLFSFAIVKNGGKTPVIVDVDTSKLPDEFVIIDEKPNLDALRKHIEETGDVTYGHLGERGSSLRIK